jgi:hypothetical protein
MDIDNPEINSATATTQSPGDNSTKVATTAYADAVVAQNVSVAATTDSTCSVGLFESATGDQQPKTDAGITYDATANELTVTGAYNGPGTGLTGSAASLNAGTATALETARLINDQSFNGTANISLNFQGVYNASLSTSILTNATNKAFTVRNFSTFDTDNIYEGMNKSGVLTLEIDGNGDVTANSYAGAGTGLTGTAASLTAGNVTTNANLTGPITSVGNATSVASQTGTGTTFVMDTSPTLVTPDLGTPSALVGTNITGTAASLTAGVSTTTTVAATTDTTCSVGLFESATGNLGAKTDAGITYNATTNVLTVSGSYSGAGTGLTGTASSLTAGIASQVSVTADPDTGTSVLLSTGTSGTQTVYTDPQITFNASSGGLTVNSDQDVKHTFGRVSLGNVIGVADYAGFSHIDNDSVSNYALLQHTGGTTFLNCATGTSIYFRVNNANKMQITGDGEILGTTQPGFAAYNSAERVNVTGDGTLYTAVFNTEIFDTAGDYNNSTYTFTAPVTGKYTFSISIWVDNASSSNYQQVRLVTSNATYEVLWDDTTTANTFGHNRQVYTLCSVDMDSGDTAYVSFLYGGGTKIVDLRGGDRNSRFSGFLQVS